MEKLCQVLKVLPDLFYKQFWNDRTEPPEYSDENCMQKFCKVQKLFKFKV